MERKEIHCFDGSFIVTDSFTLHGDESVTIHLGDLYIDGNIVDSMIVDITIPGDNIMMIVKHHELETYYEPTAEELLELCFNPPAEFWEPELDRDVDLSDDRVLDWEWENDSHWAQ